MRPNRVRVEDNAKAVKLASDARSTYVVKQDIVDGGKSLSQRAENRLLVKQRSVLGGPALSGSGFGTGHKNKDPAGILYLPVAKYLASKPDLAKRKQLLPGLIERLRAGMALPGKYAGTRI